MAKNSRNSKRVNRIGSLPKGLPIRTAAKSLDGNNSKKRGRNGDAAATTNSNPFEGKANKRLKHEVLNRSVPGSKRNPSSITLAKAFQMRQKRASDILNLGTATKVHDGSSSFKDHRIGAADGVSSQQYLSKEEAILRRLVKERVLRSKRASKFDLTSDNNMDEQQQQLTHRGQTIDESFFTTTNNDAASDEDEFYEATLSRADTELHFGGPGGNTKRSNNNAKSINPYGPAADGTTTMAEIHRSRKSELEEIIARSKLLKAEKARQKDEQVNTFETMDENFSELAELLAWNQQQKKDDLPHSNNRKSTGNESKILLQEHQPIITNDDYGGEERTKNAYDDNKEMDEWNKQVKEFLFTRKVMATDRTKTPEEIATEEAERLQKLERRRLARMNGDFEADDDLSDIDVSSSEEDDDDDDDKRGGGNKIVKRCSQRGKSSNRKKPGMTNTKRSILRNPDELDDDASDDNDPDKSIQARFTADGLIYIDKNGNVVTGKGSMVRKCDDVLKEEEEEEDDEDVSETSTHSTDEEELATNDNVQSRTSEESYDGLGSTDDEASAVSTDEASEDDEDDNEVEKNRKFDILLDAFQEMKSSNKAQEKDVSKKLKRKQLKAELQAR